MAIPVDAISSLTNASLVTNGATVDFTVPKRNVTTVVVTSGTITGGLVEMQASQDGLNWVSHTVVEPVQGVNYGVDSKYGAYRYWRANVIAAITGGGSVSATFMEAG